MKFPCIYPIVNFKEDAKPQAYIEQLLNAGAKLIQLRGKEIAQSDFIQIAIEALEFKNKKFPDAKIIINDSIEITRMVNADGIHLGQGDASVFEAKKNLRHDIITGLSTHNLEQILCAPIASLSYIALGPIFNSKTKSGHAPEVGLTTLTAAKAKLSIPLVAIGGMALENARETYKAGADCLASVSDFQTNNDLYKLINDYEKIKKEIS